MVDTPTRQLVDVVRAHPITIAAVLRALYPDIASSNSFVMGPELAEYVRDIKQQQADACQKAAAYARKHGLPTP